MKKILLTGSSGQLGSSLRFISNKYSEFQFEFTDINELDICNLESLKEYLIKNSPHFVINCAAYTAVDKAESEPDVCYLLNAEAVKNLAEACKLVNSKLIHISTDYVFDGRQSIPYREDDSPNPETVYGKSKLKGELYLKDNADAIMIRTSWLYSQFGHNFLRTILKYGNEKEELRVVNDQNGSPTFASDLAEGILSIIGDTFKPGIYHYCNNGIITWFDFAKEIIEESGLNCKIIPIETKNYPTPAPRPAYSVLDTGKIRDAFGLTIPDWKSSLHKCLDLLK